MTKLWYKDDAFEKPIHTRDFSLAQDDQGAMIADGVGWRVVFPALMEGMWEQRAKHYTNYYFAGDTGGEPDSNWVLVLTLVGQSAPVPFYTEGHTSYSSAGVHNILDLDGRYYEQRGLYWYRSDGNDGSDPGRGKRVKLRWNGTGKIQTVPPLGCDLISIAMEVVDSRKGREIRAAGAGSVEELATRSANVTLTGIKRTPNTPYCTASMAWERGT